MQYPDFLFEHELPVGYYRLRLGEVSIPSGKVVVGDPFYLPDIPFSQAVAPGAYGVDIIYKDCNEWGYRSAFAIMHIEHRPKEVHWEVAQTQTGLNSFSVDSGLACISDLETARVFNELLVEWKSDSAKNYYDDVLKEQMQKKIFPGQRISSFVIHRPFDDQRNFAVFESGMGDGSYQVYWCFDSKRLPIVLVIDFDIAEWS